MINLEIRLEAEASHLPTGTTLLQALDEREWSTLSINRKGVQNLRRIKAIYVVGPSGSGKTTLVNSLREKLEVDHGLASIVTIPLRAVSRERVNDDDKENTPMSLQEFEEAYRLRKLGLYWERFMEWPTMKQILEHRGNIREALRAGRMERYGFLPPEVGKLPVYSTNNAIITNSPSLRPVEALEDALIIAINPLFDDERVEGLVRRSPDLLGRPQELAARKWDNYFNVLNKGHDPHVDIINYGERRNKSKGEFVELVRAVANLLAA